MYTLIILVLLFNTSLFGCQVSEESEWVMIEDPETFQLHNNTEFPLISIGSCQTKIEPGNTFTKLDHFIYENSTETFEKSYFRHGTSYYQLDFNTTKIALGKSLSGMKETALDLRTLLYLRQSITTKEIKIENNTPIEVTFHEPEPYGRDGPKKEHRILPNKCIVLSTATEIAEPYHKMRYAPGNFMFLPHADDNESGQYATVKQYPVKFLQQKGHVFYIYEQLSLYAATIWWWFNGITFNQIEESKVPVFKPKKFIPPQNEGHCILS